MNVFTHDNPVKGQLQRAKRMQVGGLLAVFGSFILSLGSFGLDANVLLLVLVYVLMLIGFPVWTIGRTSLRRLKGAPKADLLIGNELKGLNDKYSLHHFVRVGGRFLPHLLVTPSGLMVLQSNDAAGQVSCSGGANGDQWKAPSGWLDRMSGLRPPVGNPSKELDAAIEGARSLLATLGKPDVPVAGLIVFTRNPDLTVEGCTYGAIPLNELKQTVRELQGEMEGERSEGARVAALLTSDDRRRINAMIALDGRPSPAKPVAARR